MHLVCDLKKYQVCVAACCSVLQRVAACCSVLQRVAACYMQCVAECCGGGRGECRHLIWYCLSKIKCVSCSVLQCLEGICIGNMYVYIYG